MSHYEKHFEHALPRDLQAALDHRPVAYVPLGTLEFHGWHLPLGFDALKAHALCVRACERTGGMVLPPSYFGFAGGHKAYMGTIMSEEAHVEANLRITFSRLHAMGFRVAVALTGHYPTEQIELVHRVAKEAEEACPGFRVLALAEPEAFQDWRGDHAAKWETSVALALMPNAVRFDAMAGLEDPLHGICGEDPREHASEPLGRETVDAIVGWITERVEAMLDGNRDPMPGAVQRKEEV